MVDFSDYIGYISSFILGAVGALLGSYFKRKGSNQADKEDSKELTNIIKEVEHNFNINLELVKSKLDNTNSILKELHNNEKDIILSVFKDIFLYYKFLTDVSFENINTENNDEIDLTIALESNKFNDLYISYQILKVFIPEGNLDIIYRYNDCMELFIKFQIKRLNYLQLLQSLNTEYKMNTVHPNNDYYTKKSKITPLYNNSVDDFIKIASPLLNVFTEEVRKYVKSKS